MAKLKPLKVIKESDANDARDYLKDKIDKLANNNKLKDIESKILANPNSKSLIKLHKDLSNHTSATEYAHNNDFLGNIRLSANKLGEKMTDHSDLADRASHHIGNDGVGYATAGTGLLALGGAIHMARKKLRSNKPVHESDDPNKWQRRAAKVVKYGLGAAAVGGLANAALGGGLLAHHVGGPELNVPNIDHGSTVGVPSQVADRVHSIVHNQNIQDMNLKKDIIGGSLVAGGLGTAALYGSGSYLAHKHAQSLEKKKQDK